MKKRLLLIVMAAIFAQLLPAGTVFASGDVFVILPDMPEHLYAEYKVGNTVLKTGDKVNIGDTITVTYTTDEGYVIEGESSQSFVVTESMLESNKEVSLDLSSGDNSKWKLGDYKPNNSVKGYGYTTLMPRNTSVSNPGTNSLTYSYKGYGETTLTFDWAINQGYVEYGRFIMNFYHNGELKITHDFTVNANPYEKILNEEYTFTANENSADTFVWEYEKQYESFPGWADSTGRTAYLGNILITSSTCDLSSEELPELKRIVDFKTWAYNGQIEISENSAYSGDEVTININAYPDENYSTEIIGITDSNNNIIYIGNMPEDGKITFTVPNTDYITIKCLFLKNDGNTFQIYTKEDLIDFINIAVIIPDINGELMQDIDMQNEKINPICPSSELIYKGSTIPEKGYLGTFDGGYHTISNFTIIPNEAEATSGLFGTVSGTVKNLNIKNAAFDNKGEYDGRFSALCGQLLSGGKITNCGVYNSQILSKDKIPGAVAGANYGGTIENCISWKNTVTGHRRAGNLVGDNQNDDETLTGTVKNSYSSSTINGDQGGNVENSLNNVSSIEEIIWRLNTVNDTVSNTETYSLANGVLINTSEENPAYYMVTKIDNSTSLANETLYYKKGSTQSVNVPDGYMAEYNGTVLENTDGISSYVVSTDKSQLEIVIDDSFEVNEKFTLSGAEIQRNADKNYWTLDETGIFKSYAVNDSETSQMSVALTIPEGKKAIFYFDYKVSADENNTGNFSVNGTQKLQMTNSNDWQSCQTELSGGENILKFEYIKNNAVSNGDDCVYIKNMSYVIVDEENHKLIAATQNTGTVNILVAAYTGSLTSAVNTEKNFNDDTAELDISSFANFSDLSDVKVFVWDSLSSMKPITDSIIIK